MVSGNYMKIFLFFTKDDEIVVLKNSEFVNKLDRKIYIKLDTEIQAENESDALEKLKKEYKDKEVDLKEFIYDVSFCALATSLVFRD